ISIHHNSAVSRSQAQDEKRGGWWQPHNVVFYKSEEELYYGYIDLRVFVLVLSYEGAAGFDQHPRLSLGLWFQASLVSRVNDRIIYNRRRYTDVS
ncbi:hypothetical protein BpHYR1_012399, partial [Brachionus plicatilis]